MADAYDETLTAEEQAALDGTTAAAAPAPAPAPAAEPAAAPAPAPVETAPAAPAAPAPAQSDDDRFRVFQERHAGKSAEELLRLAFQQEGRANQAGFSARQNQQTLDAIRERASAAATRLSEGQARIAREREQFGERLTSDPDAATRELHERLLTDEEQRLQQEERSARIDAAIGLATAAIPDFAAHAPAVYAFGGEMNYTPEELANITDGRDLCTLYLASVTGRLMKAGVIDIHGRFTQAPGAVAATDPRLTPPAAPPTLSSAPQRAGGAAPTLATQLTDLASMSEKDWDAFMAANPGALDDLLRQAN